MSTYLLLRDNKESGPYSLDDLRNKGLKAYDLVWIEGKSAAWRYPSEIDELKPYSPVVEEQPFDRFFKKPTQVSSPLTTTQPAAIKTEPSTLSGKRIIYVNMPAGKSSSGSGLRETSPESLFREPLARVEIPLRSPEPARPVAAIEQERFIPSGSPAFPKMGTSFEENNAQESEDLWRSGVESLTHRKGKSGRRPIQPVVAIVVVAAFLITGIFIGLSIKGGSFGFAQNLTNGSEVKNPPVPAPVERVEHTPSNQAPADQPSGTQQTGNQNEGTDPSTNNITPAPVSTPAAGTLNASPAVSQPLETQVTEKSTESASYTRMAAIPPATTIPVKKTGKRNKTMQIGPVLQPALAAGRDSSMMSYPVAHREAIHRNDDISLDKDAVKRNISDMVSVGAGKYSVGPFGGISNVQLTVSNHSLYALDLVVVEVQYVQANKKVFKTDNIYFRDIGPGAALMKEAPKSPRGVRVQYRITLINSKDLGLSYSAI